MSARSRKLAAPRRTRRLITDHRFFACDEGQRCKRVCAYVYVVDDRVCGLPLARHRSGR